MAEGPLNNNTIINDKHFQQKYEFLKEILPDVHPRFLEEKCVQYRRDEIGFQIFLSKCLENKQYPRKQDYDKEQQLISSKEFFQSNFDVEEFLKIIPNPEEYFTDKNKEREAWLDELYEPDLIYGEMFLKSYFPDIYAKDIYTAYRQNSYDLTKTVESLRTNTVSMLRPRCETDPKPDKDVSLSMIKEVSYIKRQVDILTHLSNKKIERRKEIDTAIANKLINTCNCCFDEEILPSETIYCPNKHSFCITCVRKHCEVKLEQGIQKFPCLENCDKFFSLKDLEAVLPSKVLTNISRSLQAQEIKEANIENLVFCPYCDYAVILPPEITILQCLNPECRKETCRFCKKPSHIPFSCEEAELIFTKKRTEIEDQLTDALVRTCYNCKRKFLKEGGCNKMTCQCGAMMCYVCKQPVKDYNHFNPQGGNKYHLCPLFSDTDELHAGNVLQKVKKLRKTLYKSELNFDPTKDTEKYYRNKKQ